MVQHEAIEALRSMANSPNKTVIYVPVGNNGIPIVTTSNVQNSVQKDDVKK
jgi:hypothetical protein